jgi:TolB-like protein/DNA-binding winged helix-turn-helix (wHTH) protein/Flp pilus assembly protein TadD
MKSFGEFSLDTANQCLWRGRERVPIPPKPYDMLRFLVENSGRLVTTDEILENLWRGVYVNPELIRKYILDIRKILGDQADNPEFIETVPKRGYRFIAPVADAVTERAVPAPQAPTALPRTEEVSAEGESPPNPQSSRRISSWVLLSLSILAVIGAATGIGVLIARRKPAFTTPSDASIAVLPFLDLSLDKDQEYFSDGLSEELIHDLARLPGLKVVARASAFQFKGKNEDLREVARKLGVGNILEGSVRRDGVHVRITTELVKATDGFQLWSQSYDLEINDIFAVQDEIASSVTAALQIKLLANNGRSVVPVVRRTNPEAYQAYLQARHFVAQGYTKEALEKAFIYAEHAIRLDENYAPAWALRATIQNRMAGFSLVDIKEGSDKARRDAQRAIELDPNLALGYLALARTQNDYDWNWDAANASLNKATELEPGNAEVLRVHSYLSRELGNLDEAIGFYKQAIALDPLRPDYHLGLGYLLHVADRNMEAHSELRKALELNPQASLVHVTLGRILITEGNPQQALAEINVEPNEWGRLTGQVLAYHALGRAHDSDAALSLLIKKYENESAYQIAEAYAFRGQSDKAFEWLERAYRQRDGGLTDVKIDPLFERLWKDSRYAEFLRKMHFPN